MPSLSFPILRLSCPLAALPRPAFWLHFRLIQPAAMKFFFISADLSTAGRAAAALPPAKRPKTVANKQQSDLNKVLTIEAGFLGLALPPQTVPHNQP